MNANFYGDERALAEMASLLGKEEEAARWRASAAAVKVSTISCRRAGDTEPVIGGSARSPSSCCTARIVSRK